jgi:hypothetical protein
MKSLPLSVFLLFLTFSDSAGSSLLEGRWTEAKANYWYQRFPWIIGCNYITSTAVNQLEMWQGDTFDQATIDRELRWAADIGFNTIRVFLHDLPWVANPEGFRTRINTFLDIAQKYNLRTIFVLFDDCWNPNPVQGPQLPPIPGVHNSRWVQSPGKNVVNDPDLWPRLERYVKDIVRAFAADNRVLMWDLYNEPGNSGQGEKSFPLLKKVFEWAREIAPSQPLTVAVYDGMDGDLESYALEESDVITFHNYKDAENLQGEIESLKKEGRPVICTEWLARTLGSVVESCLPVFKKEKVGCLNWGLVAGKTQTMFPWGSKEGTPAPEVWFHDLLKSDGTPYDQTEIDLIRAFAGRKSTEK